MLETPVSVALEVQRKIYITSRGLIGVRKPYARIRDLVCVLKGCFRPILVRRKGEVKGEEREAGAGELGRERRVVEGLSYGCSYLCGYMDGRAVMESSSGVLKTLYFSIGMRSRKGANHIGMRVW